MVVGIWVLRIFSTFSMLEKVYNKQLGLAEPCTGSQRASGFSAGQPGRMKQFCLFL